MKYNWNEIQQKYDSGLSFRKIQNEYGCSSATLVKAVRRGDLKSRNKKEAAKNNHVPTKHTEEFKNKQRQRINERYSNGWMPKAGRCKKYSYSSPIAGNISVDGTWELAVAKMLDFNAYNWRRNTKRFSYMKPDGSFGYYTPDFWVEELGGYLEIKGHETELDRCKWSQFNEPLIIWKKEKILPILKEFGIQNT